MHRKIVEALKAVLDKYAEDHDDDLFSFYVMSQKTDGFWRVVIIADEDREYFLPHIKSVAKSIGLLFGESLCTEIKDDRLMLS